MLQSYNMRASTTLNENGIAANPVHVDQLKLKKTTVAVQLIKPLRLPAYYFCPQRCAISTVVLKSWTALGFIFRLPLFYCYQASCAKLQIWMKEIQKFKFCAKPWKRRCFLWVPVLKPILMFWFVKKYGIVTKLNFILLWYFGTEGRIERETKSHITFVC